MEITPSAFRGIPLLRVTGEIDHESGPRLRAAAYDSLEACRSHLLLDLAACPYIDSGGVSVFLDLIRAVNGSDGWLGVVGANANLRRLFEIVGLTSLPQFRLLADLAEIADAPPERPDGEGAAPA